FFFQAEDGIRDDLVTGVQTCALPIFARAIAIDPRILILDDALSAVDTYTEEEILSRLHVVMRQRTSIIVSHRISTVRGADQILRSEERRVGKGVEFGGVVCVAVA